MAEITAETHQSQPRQPSRGRMPRNWSEFGSRLVPGLAVVTAMIFGAVFMVAAATDWAAARAAFSTEGVGGFISEVRPGIGRAGIAYGALFEGAAGLGYVDPSSIRAQTFYVTLLPLGERSLVFIPRNLIDTIVRTIPFILAGLAVALGFKCGLFNIGAEGQLYAGGLLAALIGFHPAFRGLPSLIHIPLAVAAGTAGGLLWGAIPGFLKARTGAHEVINTIMMNYIAIRLADWLIKSREPVIMLDTTASVPRTPFIAQSAMYPYLANTSLHFGLFVALAAVWLVWWFLYRTTLGFEIRTVGTNPSAARYAGMSVSRSIVLAMTLSGGLAGLAGAGEVLGVQHNLSPGFYAGVGFDSIAIALLAKTNPFAVVPAALLWGGLINGAGLMQVRADLSIDVVKIIQAFIVMFIAADQIVRALWRIRARRRGEEVVFARGWS